MNPAVWAYSESEPVSNEVATAAAEVGKGLSAQPVVVEIGALRGGVRAPGGKLLVKGPQAPDVSPDVAAEALARAAKALQPMAILIGATRDGRETASRLAAKLAVGCLTELTKLGSEGGALIGERNVFAGKVVAKMSCALPAVATVKVGFYPQNASGPGQTSATELG